MKKIIYPVMLVLLATAAFAFGNYTGNYGDYGVGGYYLGKIVFLALATFIVSAVFFKTKNWIGKK